MKILVIGSGGREHTLCWQLRKSKHQLELFCAPGNGGIATCAQLVPINMDETTKLLNFALDEQIDLTIVGPEAPLAAGIVDIFKANGLKIFGPTQKAAEIESSKAFAKRIMDKYQIPTAAYQVFTEEAAAINFVREKGAPIVIKADGIAAGKGVVVAQTLEQAIDAVRLIFTEYAAGGGQVLIEEFLEGEELSLMAFVDGETVVPMQTAQDHKQVFDLDQGPNTGGMGAYSPVPQFDDSLVETAVQQVLIPAAKGMVKEGRHFTGVLYAGLIITKTGPKVIEFNARFGDPEAQVVLPRMKTDLLNVILACVNHKLDQVQIEWAADAVVTIVLASPGYPGTYTSGSLIKGLDSVNGSDQVVVFHSGTARSNCQFYTAGGRVLSVTGFGNDLDQARNCAYEAIEQINFSGMHYRKDICTKALACYLL